MSIHTHVYTHTFNGPFSGTTRVGRYRKGKTNLDFTEARDSEWQWHQLGHMQVCTSLQTDNHASTTPLSFLQAGCSSCRPTNSVKALKAIRTTHTVHILLTVLAHTHTHTHARTHAHTHTHLTALCPGLPGSAGTRKVKPIWILLKQETVSGSGTSLQRDNHASTPPLSFLQARCPSSHQNNCVKALC